MSFWQSLQPILPTSQSLLDELVFRLLNLSLSEALDLILVTLTFYVLLSLIQRSQVSVLFRGQLVLIAILFIATILLPLPTFDWLVLGLLIAVLVATPVIFQPELRRFLERIGRNAGLTRAVRQTATENMIPRLVRAVESMSASHTGALIALEGKRVLQEVIETGVPIEGQVSSELLQAIFYPENPLHDGAVVLREDRIVAASCVLPLSEFSLPTRRRLGTRHRAAVGLSEVSDALVIVVSEETGTISIARDGELRRPLDGAMLREQLFNFYVPPQPTGPPLSLRGLFSQTEKQLQKYRPHPLAGRPDPRFISRSFLPRLGRFFIALLLALVAWSFVIERTNPSRQELFENIPLRVENIPPGTTLMEPPPADVSAQIQTSETTLRNLRPSSFQAVVSLEGLQPGLHSLPIQVISGASRVRVLSVEPAVLDVELAPIITRTLEVTVDLPDRESLSPAYRVVGSPFASPSRVQVRGAAPWVEQVEQVQAVVSVSNANTSIQQTRPVQALDETGQEVSKVSLQPNQVEVTVFIEQQLNARNVGVRPVTTGTPPEGYRLSSLSVTPANITLQGNLGQLTGVDSYVDTLPIDLSQATGDLTLQVPLALPANVQALDDEGSPIRTVTVQAQIMVRNSYLQATRQVELLGITSDITATVSPATVDLIMSGPLPVLQQIETDPGLVQVVVDVAGIDPPQTITRKLRVVNPEDIQVQLIPESVRITLSP